MRFLISVLLFMSACSSPPSKDIVVSNKPLYGLVAKLLKGTDHKLDLLYDGSTSPHTTGLNVHTVEKVQKATLIFWAGAIYETALQRHLADHPHAVDLSKTPSLTLFHNRTFDEEHTTHHSSCEHKHEHGHECDHDHLPTSMDGHYWLHIANAKAIVVSANEILSAQFPLEKEVFEKNTKQALKDLDILKETLMAKIKPLKYISFHDFTQYFDHAFGTKCVGVIVTDPHTGSNVKHIAEILSQAKSRDISFIIREKQFNAPILEKFKDQGISVKTLDYLGSDLPANDVVYEQIMTDLAEAFG